MGRFRGLKALDRILRRWMAAAIYSARRTRRVIVVPESRPFCEEPIFVLGAHRSGTTLLRLILDSHPRIACPPESFFIAPLEALHDDEKAMEGLRAMGFDEEHVLRRLRETVSYFFETYCASQQKVRWADKTPSYVECADFIERLFGPRCRYVIIYRHGLDVACSISGMEIREVEPHVEACRGDRAAGAARYWATQCERLLRFQEAHATRCFVTLYEELTRNPEPELRRMFEFLGEAWEPRVLRFYEQPHDHWVGLQDNKAADSRGFSPRIGIWRRQPAEVIDRMLAEAAPMLETLGYSMRLDCDQSEPAAR